MSTVDENELTEFREQAEAWFGENTPREVDFMLPLPLWRLARMSSSISCAIGKQGLRGRLSGRALAERIWRWRA